MLQPTQAKDFGDGIVIGAIMLAAGYLIGAIGGCDPLPPDFPEPTQGTCLAACKHLSSMGCEEGTPTPEGASCVEVCEHGEVSNVVKWNLGCLASVSRCADTSACVVIAQ